MVTLVAALNIAAAGSSKAASGVLMGCRESSVNLIRRNVASWRAVSPEITMTLTPRFAIAVLIAISRTLGIWLGCEMNSQ